MQAARLHGPRDLRPEQVDRPADPPPGWVRLSVGAVGICGSDLHMYRCGRIGDTEFVKPLIIGHEFAGVIEAVAEDVPQRWGLRPGQRVAVDPHRACGACEICHQGHPNLCPHHTFAGVYPTDGALAEAILAPAETCFALPPELDDEDGALLEPLGVALHAVDLAHIRPGFEVAVVGLGPIGLLCLRVSQLAGAARTYAQDPLEHRREAARVWGARDWQDIPQRGVDVAFEAAWSDEASLHAAASALRPGGRLVVVGISEDDRLCLTHSLARRKGLTIALCRRSKHTYPRAIRLASEGMVDLKAIVTHRLGLAQSPEALQLAESPGPSQAVKVMVQAGA